MKRVLFNLIKNSVDVLHHDDAALEVSFYREGDSHIIRISDNGPGIPDDIKDTLFEPFVTSGKDTGTGLGTAIAKKVIEEHGGKIWFESEPGKGTVFYIKFPVEFSD